MSRVRVVVLAAVAAGGLVLVGLPVLLFTTILGGTSERPAASCDPGAGGPAVELAGAGSGLSPVQLSNAAAIVAEGQRMGVPRRGVVVALAVALQESGLWNYANDGQGSDLGVVQQPIAASLGLPHERVGSDHGSLGVFQQQWPWWGTMAELMTPSVAARKFYTALLRVPGWQWLPVTVAGQRVQRSAYPDAYADDEALAVALLGGAQPAPGTAPAPVVGDAFYDPDVTGPASAGAGCADFTLCPATGLPVEAGLTPDALIVVRCVVAEFAITTLGGVGSRGNNPSSAHPSGRAVDVMIPGWDTPAGVALGDRVAAWARANATRMGVTQVIWHAQIWTTARTNEGWRAYTHPAGASDPTSAHLDHVHVTVAGNAAVQPAYAMPAGTVTYPLPAGSGFTDRGNWGHSGGRWARGHTGTDLSVRCGTPVLAAHAGRVVVDTGAGWAGRWLVKVSTGTGGLTTWYAHMQALTVTAGQTVVPGQQLGEVGALGNSTGCHLHFEVHPAGGSIYADDVNPTAWLAGNVGRTPTAPAGVVRPASAGGGSGAGSVGLASVIRPVSAATGEFVLATFNVLGSSHTGPGGKRPGMASGPTRVRWAVQLLDRYHVDVVGLQEFQSNQRRAFLAAAGGRYAVYSPPGDTDNSLAWRAARWQLVHAQTVAIPYFDGHLRRMPVVMLRDKATGGVSVFVNVHNPADTRRFPHQARHRAAAVRREITLTHALTRRGVPTFLTGDLNDRHGVYCRFAAAGLHAAAGGGHDGSAGGCRPPAYQGIDWILGNQYASFTGHGIDRSPQVRRASDHPLVLTHARGTTG